MKKIKWLSMLLCLTLVLQCALMPVSAVETTQAQLPEETAETTPVEEELTFGTVSVKKGCRTIEGMEPVGGRDPRLETAQSAFLYEITTDTVVYSYNADMKVHPGTLAKMVLALLVLENCELDEIVEVTEGIQSYIPAGSKNIKLKSYEHISVKDLLYAVMLVGANDASVALAHHVAGTTAAFLEMMNNRVKMMGCTNTEFGNISGLYTAQSYSTARDMAKIVREAIKNKEFVEIFGATEMVIEPTDMTETKREEYTSNYMLDEHNIPDFFDTRVTGGMQSQHDSIGASIVCTAKEKKENYPLHYIAVVLCATRTYHEVHEWMPVYYGNFNELTELLKYGFENFKINRVIYDGMTLSQFTVAGGECNAVGYATVNIDSVVPATAQMQNLVTRFSVVDGGLSAPVKKDQLIATMQLEYRNCVLAEAEIYSMGTVQKTTETGVNIRSTAIRSDSDDSGFLKVVGVLSVIVLGLAAAYLAFNAYMRSRMRARRRRRRENRRRNRG